MKKLEHGHKADEIADRLERGPDASYLRDWVYGGVDGVVTTFAVVSGVVGADLDPSTILILGAANLAADGFSMAASNFLGTRAERDESRAIEAYERRQVRVAPEGEREEVRQILSRKGLSGDVLEESVRLITADEKRWVELMLADEYGLPSTTRSAWRAGLHTFLAFVVCGSIPLLPYVFGASRSFLASSVAAGATFVLIGSLKSRWTLSPWWRSGLLTFAVGGVASVLAYAVGMLFR